ncbi:uncharacterized protein LOC117062570 [Trachypithecus francoisi]|uniref:uncharacterized protein LOC117062570 n=1 Tax=Trachypithecus francoisi TaxID=54180 RepID=UPI00141B9708|nr:uncharacterized protein LOC117062570 [Trachypithecus francoisi]
MSLSRLLRMEAKMPPASGSYHLSRIPPQRLSTRIFPPQALLLPRPSPVFLPHSRLLCPFHRLFTVIKAVTPLLLRGDGQFSAQPSCPTGYCLAQDVLSPAVLPDPHRPPAPQVTAWPRTFSARLSSQIQDQHDHSPAASATCKPIPHRFPGALPSPLPEASSPTSPSPRRAQTLIVSRCHFHKDLLLTQALSAFLFSCLM